MPPQLAYRRLNPAKLLLSKWTAAQPSMREKHFLVTKLIEPEAPATGIEWVEIEAIYSRRCERIAWRELCDASRWLQGWK